MDAETIGPDIGTHQTLFSEPSGQEIVATRMFDAPRKLVWDAHTLPEQVSQWLLGPDGWEMQTSEIDLRPQGAWRFVWNGRQEALEMHGEYREVVPPERIVNTQFMGTEAEPSINTLTLTEHAGRTTLTLRAEFPSESARNAAIATGMEAGWAESYERLDRYLRTRKERVGDESAAQGSA